MSSCPLLTELAAATWLPRRQAYLVGVSGGVDSVSLLHALVHAGYRDLTVCHLHHGLRGDEADRDAALVARLAADLGLPLETDRIDVRALAAADRCSMETAGRDARHRFFARVAAHRRCPRVILGHHAGDQFETILMRLFRGAASMGRCGMQPRQLLRVNARPPSAGDPDTAGNDAVTAAGAETPAVSELQLLRPLLDLPAAELSAYAIRQRLPYREDRSNRDPAFLRNRVRHQLVPLLRELFRRDPAPAVLRLAAMAAEDEAWLHDTAAAELERHRHAGEPGESPASGDDAADFDPASVAAAPSPPALGPARVPTLEVARLNRLPAPLRRRVIHLWLQGNAVADIDHAAVTGVMALLQPDPASGRPARCNLANNLQAARTGGRLRLHELGGAGS